MTSLPCYLDLTVQVSQGGGGRTLVSKQIVYSLLCNICIDYIINTESGKGEMGET